MGGGGAQDLKYSLVASARSSSPGTVDSKLQLNANIGTNHVTVLEL